DLGLYFGLTVVQNDEADAQLAAEAGTVAEKLKVTDGRVVYAGGDLPDQTPEGVAIDIAVVGRNGVVAATPSRPLGPTVLAHLAAPVMQTGRPIWVDLREDQGATRRVYATPVPGGRGQDLVLLISTSLGEFQATVARTMALIAGLSLLVLVS